MNGVELNRILMLGLVILGGSGVIPIVHHLRLKAVWGVCVFVLKWVTFNMSIMIGQRGTKLLLRARFSNRRGVQ